MQDISKAVLRRLRETSPAEDHLDPNMLTAFAEQSLAESEHGEVLKHLARCENCRKIISLVLPANEVVALPNSVISRGGWLSWPVLRWTVVAAGIILTSAGVLQYQRHQQTSAVITKDIAPHLNPDALQDSLPSSQAASSPAFIGPEAGGEKTDVQQRLTANTKGVTSTGRASSGTNATPQRMHSAEDSGNRTRAADVIRLHAVGKAKNPIPSQAQSITPPAPAFAPPAVPLQTSPALLQRALPRWTISSAGGLQRSFDTGQTWEDVNVIGVTAENRSVIGNAAKERAAAQYKNEKSIGKNGDESLASSNLIFRAVAAMGTEVWAGGSNTILYHSVDSGIDWIKVFPSETGTVLSGDITSIEVSNPKHCRISTSTGEVWLTANDGETWQKQ